MIFLVVFLSIILCGLGYATYNLYRKYDELEKVAQENVDFILSIRSRVLSQQSYLKQLDRKGAFESDDEVGYFFKELKKIINDISFYLEVDNEQTQEEETVESQQFRGKIQRF